MPSNRSNPYLQGPEVQESTGDEADGSKDSGDGGRQQDKLIDQTKRYDDEDTFPFCHQVEFISQLARIERTKDTYRASIRGDGKVDEVVADEGTQDQVDSVEVDGVLSKHLLVFLWG